MDKQVELALAKWPNVPHCYGWLGLDARGVWRMRDQRAQELGLLGDKITNVALRGFINRNYQSDQDGNYYFQNGPQRVYVDLQSTPYIAHLDPARGWVLHNDAVLPRCDAVWMLEDGNLVLHGADVLAQIDDRDMTAALTELRFNDQSISDEFLLNWLENPQVGLTFLFNQRPVPVQLTNLAELARQYRFISKPIQL